MQPVVLMTTACDHFWVRYCQRRLLVHVQSFLKVICLQSCLCCSCQKACLESGLNELNFGPQARYPFPLQPRQTPQGVSDGHPLHMYWLQPAFVKSPYQAAQEGV